LIGLNIKVDVYKPTTATDTGWNVDELSYPAIPTYRSVKARISTLKLSERESLQVIRGGESIVAAHRIFLAAGEDVEIDDRIGHDGKMYEVVSMEDMDRTEQHLEGVIVYWEGVVS